MIPYLIIFVLLLIVIVIFSFPQFSPIPYFPSNIRDMELIVKTLRLQNNQTVIDLGAGDGVVIFEASRKAFLEGLNTVFYAVEINPILLFILHVRRLFHPNRKNIHIMKKDMFTMDYSFFSKEEKIRIVFYIYISPWYIQKTITNITTQLKKFNVVSYFYQVKVLPKHKEYTNKKGVHSIYSYTI